MPSSSITPKLILISARCGTIRGSKRSLPRPKHGQRKRAKRIDEKFPENSQINRRLVEKVDSKKDKAATFAKATACQGKCRRRGKKRSSAVESGSEAVAKHRQAALRFGFGRFVPQNIPVVGEAAVLDPDNIRGDRGNWRAQSC